MKQEPKQPPKLPEQIEQEKEWSPTTAALRDKVVGRFTDQIDALLEKHPEALQKAAAIIVNAGNGKTVFVLSDPAAHDIATELRRLAAQGNESPLAALAAARIKL